MLYFMPKSSLGPPGLWLADRNAAKGLVFANHAGSRRSRENAPLTHQHPTKAVGRRHFENNLNGLAVVVATIAPHHQGLVLVAFQAVENGFG
jgi:hypothetical protein